MSHTFNNCYELFPNLMYDMKSFDDDINTEDTSSEVQIVVAKWTVPSKTESE